MVDLQFCEHARPETFLVGVSPVLLRGAAGSDAIGREKAGWGCPEGGAVVAPRRNAHGHTRQGTGERYTVDAWYRRG